MESFISHGWAGCPKCNTPLTIHPTYDLRFFEKPTRKCPSCRQEFSQFEFLERTLTTEPADWFLFSVLGAKQLIFTFEIRPGEGTSIDMHEKGLPTDAHLLGITYTPQGPGAFPIEMHGNTPNRRLRTQLVLHGVPLGEQTSESMLTEVAAVATYIEPRADNPAFRSLLAAFEAFREGLNENAIIQANVAVEMTVGDLVGRILEISTTKKRLDEFFSDATFGHQLNVLLPFFVDQTSVPRFPEEYLGRLSRLKNLRNDAAHRATLRGSPSKAEIAGLIFAAFMAQSWLTAIADPMIESFRNGKSSARSKPD